MQHGKNYQDLKRIVMEFANNATNNIDPNAMQCNTVGEKGRQEEGKEKEAAGEHDGGFNAFGGKSGGVQCYGCGEWGHIARNYAKETKRGQGITRDSLKVIRRTLRERPKGDMGPWDVDMGEPSIKGGRPEGRDPNSEGVSFVAGIISKRSA